MSRTRIKIEARTGREAPLGPALTRLIPILIEQASLTRHAIAPALRELEAQVESLQDLVAHEIDRIELALERAAWESRSDRVEEAFLRERLALFRSIRDTHTAIAVRASVEAITELSAAVEQLEQHFSCEDRPATE